MVVENNFWGSKTAWLYLAEFASTQKPIQLVETKLKGQAKGEVLILIVSDLVPKTILLSHKIPNKSTVISRP